MFSIFKYTWKMSENMNMEDKGPYVGQIREGDGRVWDGSSWVSFTAIPAEAVEVAGDDCIAEERELFEAASRHMLKPLAYSLEDVASRYGIDLDELRKEDLSVEENASVCGEAIDHEQRLTHQDADSENWVCDRCGAEWWQDKPK